MMLNLRGIRQELDDAEHTLVGLERQPHITEMAVAVITPRPPRVVTQQSPRYQAAEIRLTMKLVMDSSNSSSGSAGGRR
jgi:hypothetical protein